MYITPSGPLGRACERYWSALNEASGESGLQPTAAQAYPPHCTLTGFFERSPDRLPELIADIETAIDGASPRSRQPVAVMGVVDHDRWVGLQLESPWLDRFITVLCLVHETAAGEDELRPKDWLHLSLAYGLDTIEEDVTPIDPYVDLAHEVVDPALDVEWFLGLWERAADRSWRRLAEWPITNAPLTG